MSKSQIRNLYKQITAFRTLSTTPKEPPMTNTTVLLLVD